MAKIKYVIENGSQMPLCAIKDSIFIDYFTGIVISNKNALEFIMKNLENRTFKVVNMDLFIYVVVDCKLPANDRDFVAYNYKINGCSNYLDMSKKTLSSTKRNFIIDKLIKGEYKEELLWGENDEKC